MIFTVLGDSKLSALLALITLSIVLLMLSGCTVEYLKGPAGEVLKMVPGCAQAEQKACPDKETIEREKTSLSPLSGGKAPITPAGHGIRTYLYASTEGPPVGARPWSRLAETIEAQNRALSDYRLAGPGPLYSGAVSLGSRSSPTCITEVVQSRFRRLDTSLQATGRAPKSAVQNVYCWQR